MDEATLRIKLEIGDKSIADLKKMRKELQSAFEGARPGSSVFDEAGQKVALLGNRISELRQKTETENAKMMKSYFQLGQSLRSAQMVGVNFSRVMQDIPFGLMAIQNNIEPLLTSLGQMKREAAEAGVSFKTSLISAISGTGGMIAGITILIPLITNAVEQLRKFGDEARKAGDETRDILGRIGPYGTAQRIGMQREAVSKAEARETRAREIVAGIGMPTSVPEYQMRQAAIAEAAKAERDKFKAWEELQKLEEQLIKEEEAKVRSTKASAPKGGGGRISSSEDFFTSSQYGSIREIRRGAPGLGFIGKPTRPSALGGVSGPSMMMPNVTTGLVADWSKLTDQMGQSLTSALTLGFMQGFQNGTNLLKSFTDAVLSSLLGIAAQQASIGIVSGLLSLIPGVGTFGAISGALGGIFSSLGSSGGAVPVAGGQEGINGTLKGIQNAVESLELRVDNVGLYMGVSRGKLLKEAR